MRLALSTSPHVRHAAVLQSDFRPSTGAVYGFSPVGLLSLIAQMRRQRPDVQSVLYDINRRIMSGTLPLDGRLYEAVAQELIATEADIIGFMTECDSYHHVLQVCLAIKAASPRRRVILGGPHASAVARATMLQFPCIDAVVIGEGEVTLPELIAAFAEGRDDPIPGTLRRRRDGSLADGGPRPLIEELDTLPVPAYDLYSPDPGEELFLEVGRGCPFQCEFCSTAPYWHRRHRVKSPGRIAREIHEIRTLFGDRRIHFTHDLFTTSRSWVTDVCERLIGDETAVRWTCSARTDTVDRPLLELMDRAGCDGIYFGVESGSQRVLGDIKKNVPLSQSFEAISACKGAGIAPSAGFIVGLPNEDPKSFKDTLDAYEHSLRLGCKHAHIFGYNPFAGSPLYSKLGPTRCEGHFVDLPLGPATDSANRDRVCSDRDLFGSYFRPCVTLVDGEAGALAAIDEFSPLVEAVLMPTLVLAKCVGGMHEVFRLWLRWIRETNRDRGAANYRIGFGSPAQFAKFVREALEGQEAPEAAVEAAKAIEINLRVGEKYATCVPTTMSSHRSAAMPRPQDSPAVRLHSQLACVGVVAAFGTSVDVRPALRGERADDLVRCPTYLIWQRLADGEVRLLDVEESVFDIVQALLSSRLSVGDLLLKSFSQAEPPNPDNLFGTVSSLADAGLIEVGGKCGR